MGFFGRMFGADSTVDSIRKAYARHDWAAVLMYAEDLSGVAADELSHVNAMIGSAGDALARLNLEQAEACLRAEDLIRAQEHLALALGQGRDVALLDHVRNLLNDLSAPPVKVTARPDADNCSDCRSGTTGSSEHIGTDLTEPPEEAWELTLAALPPHWADRYGQLNEALQQAILLAHAGLDQEALDLFLSCSESGPNDVISYELASLYLRSGELDKGIGLLRSLLDSYPEHDLALHLAIDLTMQQTPVPWLFDLLHENLKKDIQPALCHAGLAKLAALAGDGETLLFHSGAALRLGHIDPDLMIWAARAHEQRGQITEAEAILCRLSGGGGCAGGVNPLLGEFWLRHNKNPDQALASFKDAARHDPENPRWALRIAQSYLLKGWNKEASGILNQVLRTPQLDRQLHDEALAALEAIGKM